jgi:hypothetical protein
MIAPDGRGNKVGGGVLVGVDVGMGVLVGVLVAVTVGVEVDVDVGEEVAVDVPIKAIAWKLPNTIIEPSPNSRPTMSKIDSHSRAPIPEVFLLEGSVMI